MGQAKEASVEVRHILDASLVVNKLVDVVWINRKQIVLL